MLYNWWVMVHCQIKDGIFLNSFFISYNGLFIFFLLLSPIFHVCLDLIFNVIYIHRAPKDNNDNNNTA